MDLPDRGRTWVEDTCQRDIDDDHPLHAEAVGGQEHLLLEISREPGAVGPIIGRGGRNIEAIRTAEGYVMP
jgi:predicted RNA-binding protein YlqC (UPF0109 family)